MSAVAIGFVLRVAMWIALPHPLMTYTDANVYVNAAREFLFRPVEGRTAGYPLFLRVTHGIVPSVDAPVVLQHLMPLAACVGLYAVLVRADVPRWLAALPALVWAVSIDWIWLEHQLMTEALGAALLVAALVVVAVPRPSRAVWAVALGAAGGALLLAAGVARPAMFPAAPGVGLAVLLLMRAPLRWRLGATVACVAACGVLLAGYVKAQEDKTGFRGIVGSELNLGGYPLAGSVADCSTFKVPRGTASLCERTPPQQRPGPDYYYWDATSPGRQLLARRPDLAAAIRLWGARALAADGAAVWRERENAYRRLFGLGGFQRPKTEAGPETFSLTGADTGAAQVTVDAITAYYGRDDGRPQRAGAPYDTLAAIQDETRVPGPLLLVALALALAGGLLGLGRARRAAWVFLAAGWVPVLYAVWAASQYNWRYVLVGVPLIVAGAAAGAGALARRISVLRGERDVAADSPAPLATEPAVEA